MKINKKKFIYLISPNKIDNKFYPSLNKVLKSGKVSFFQMRLKRYSLKKKIQIGKKIKLICKQNNVKLLINDDPILTKKLEDVGACSIMPLAAPIGSGIGIQNKTNITLIKEQSSVPVIVDAGVGTASDATIAMELGCDGVLVNTAIAEAKNPVLMAEAMKHAVKAGRKAFKAERMKKRKYGNASSPQNNLI